MSPGPGVKASAQALLQGGWGWSHSPAPLPLLPGAVPGASGNHLGVPQSPGTWLACPLRGTGSLGQALPGAGCPARGEGAVMSCVSPTPALPDLTRQAWNPKFKQTRHGCTGRALWLRAGQGPGQVAVAQGSVLRAGGTRKGGREAAEEWVGRPPRRRHPFLLLFLKVREQGRLFDPPRVKTSNNFSDNTWNRTKDLTLRVQGPYQLAAHRVSRQPGRKPHPLQLPAPNLARDSFFFFFF